MLILYCIFQEAEAKAAAAEENERTLNDRLSQSLSRITVLETQVCGICYLTFSVLALIFIPEVTTSNRVITSFGSSDYMPQNRTNTTEPIP